MEWDCSGSRKRGHQQVRQTGKKSANKTQKRQAWGMGAGPRTEGVEDRMHRRAGRTNELCWSCPTRTTEGCSEWPAPLGLCSARREEGRQHPCTGGHFSSVSFRLCVSPGTTGLAISFWKTIIFLIICPCLLPPFLVLLHTFCSGIFYHGAFLEQ